MHRQRLPRRQTGEPPDKRLGHCRRCGRDLTLRAGTHRRSGLYSPQHPQQRPVVRPHVVPDGVQQLPHRVRHPEAGHRPEAVGLHMQARRIGPRRRRLLRRGGRGLQLRVFLRDGAAGIDLQVGGQPVAELVEKPDSAAAVAAALIQRHQPQGQLLVVGLVFHDPLQNAHGLRQHIPLLIQLRRLHQQPVLPLLIIDALAEDQLIQVLAVVEIVPLQQLAAKGVTRPLQLVRRLCLRVDLVDGLQIADIVVCPVDAAVLPVQLDERPPALAGVGALFDLPQGIAQVVFGGADGAVRPEVGRQLLPRVVFPAPQEQDTQQGAALVAQLRGDVRAVADDLRLSKQSDLKHSRHLTAGCAAPTRT